MAKEDPRLHRLRVGDSERYAAVDALGEHYVAGRLDAEEHQQRCGQALQARTGADLMRLFADLPLPHPDLLPAVASSPRPTPSARPRRTYPTALVAVVAIVALMAVVRAPFLVLLLVGVAIYLVLSRRG